MLSARSVAVVGASDRPESFGRRLTLEALRSPGIERVHLVHPTRSSVLDRPPDAVTHDVVLAKGTTRSASTGDTDPDGGACRP